MWAHVNRYELQLALCGCGGLASPTLVSFPAPPKGGLAHLLDILINWKLSVCHITCMHGLGHLLESPPGVVTDIEKLYQATFWTCGSSQIGCRLVSFDRIPKYNSHRWVNEAVTLRIARYGSACQHLGKHPKGNIKISSKSARPPFGPLQNGSQK